MANDPSSKDEPPQLAPVASGNQLSAANSNIGNAAQVIGSPGAVVTQVHLEQSSALAGMLAGILGTVLLVLSAVLPLLVRGTSPVLTLTLAAISSVLLIGGFFEWVESLLTRASKEEIAVWLMGVSLGNKTESWPHTFLKLCDKIFGNKLVSFEAFMVSNFISFAFMTLGVLAVYPRAIWLYAVPEVYVAGMLVSSVPDWLSSCKTRLLLRRQLANHMNPLILLLIDCTLTAVIGFVGLCVATVILSYDGYPDLETELLSVPKYFTFSNPRFILWFFPAFATSAWVWIYVAAGLVLKAAKRFDIGFRWFNRHFDIERKPLSAMGLVAGAMVACVYWGVSAGMWLLGK